MPGSVFAWDGRQSLIEPAAVFQVVFRPLSVVSLTGAESK